MDEGHAAERSKRGKNGTGYDKNGKGKASGRAEPCRTHKAKRGHSAHGHRMVADTIRTTHKHARHTHTHTVLRRDLEKSAKAKHMYDQTPNNV